MIYLSQRQKINTLGVILEDVTYKTKKNLYKNIGNV